MRAFMGVVLTVTLSSLAAGCARQLVARDYAFDPAFETVSRMVQGPKGIAADNRGNVYLCDSWNNRVLKIAPDGRVVAEWGREGRADGEFQGPTGIAVDSTGCVYVSDGGNRRIQKFDANGRFLAKWGTSDSGAGELSAPTGVAVDARGNVYVSDIGSNRVLKFVPAGRKR